VSRITDVAVIERALTDLATRARTRQASLDPQLSLVATTILRTLERDAPVRAVDIAVRYGLDKSLVSRQVAVLEERGCLERGARGGREGQLLHLTATGRALLDIVTDAQRAQLAGQTASWSATELRTLAALLGRLTG
jgi:DNA-binding MarR family transcriptional regulator